MTNDIFTWFEDLAPGQHYAAGPVEVTEADVLAFGRKFDPQDFHTDPALAKDTMFGGLIASGWHTAALTMRMIVAAMPKMKGGMVGVAVEKMNWLRPVRPGDTLTYKGEITDLFPLAPDATRGTFRVKSTTFNQKGKAVLYMETLVSAPRRPAQ
ncbi:MAG TPA: MaoC family dehydratase [Patescibacteria group bacterium]|nr:MaoC family dehydratase [Patescibacteria group bacterium]